MKPDADEPRLAFNNELVSGELKANLFVNIIDYRDMKYILTIRIKVKNPDLLIFKCMIIN